MSHTGTFWELGSGPMVLEGSSAGHQTVVLLPPVSFDQGEGSSPLSPRKPPAKPKRKQKEGSTDGGVSLSSSSMSIVPSQLPESVEAARGADEAGSSDGAGEKEHQNKNLPFLFLQGQGQATVEEEHGLLSPFTSVLEGSLDGDVLRSLSGNGTVHKINREEDNDDIIIGARATPTASSTSFSSLLDGITLATSSSAAATSPAQSSFQQQVSLGDDGFITSPVKEASMDAENKSSSTEKKSIKSPLSSTSVNSSSSSTSTVVLSPGDLPVVSLPSPNRRKNIRRMSTGTLPNGAVGAASITSPAISNTNAFPPGGSSSKSMATPRTTGGKGTSSKLSLDGLRAKLSSRKSSRDRDKGGLGLSSSLSLADSGSGAVIQSAKRLGLDITGLRRALLIRILGVEALPASNGNKKDKNKKAQNKRNRSASTGVIPVSWLKRSTNSNGADAGSGNNVEETYAIVIWVLDVESGQEWRIRKGPSDFMALHEVISVLRPGIWTEDFPLRRNKSEFTPLSIDEQARLERYLRKLASAMDLSPSTSNFEVAKTLQDYVGATERVDILTDVQHRDDVHLRQLVQIYGVDLMRQQPEYDRRLNDFLDEANNCDVRKTDLLKAYTVFIGNFARDMMEQHGERLKAIVDVSRRRLMNDDDIEQFCISSLRRLLEAETFLPLRLRLYERVMIETDLAQEKQLAAKCAIFKSRPQSFFGIPVAHISISSWETAVNHLRRLSGDITTLPSDKLDVLVAAVKEVHALFRREHADAKDLGADELLPVFIYVVSQCGISRLLSLKNMLAGLCDPGRLMSEPGYCLATLEAAIDYLLQLDENADEI